MTTWRIKLGTNHWKSNIVACLHSKSSQSTNRIPKSGLETAVAQFGLKTYLCLKKKQSKERAKGSARVKKDSGIRGAQLRRSGHA
jgi:hypothetical protein